MELKFVPVTAENRREAESLEVCPDQADFIEPVAECMAEADALADWQPVCLMDGDTMVGFAMYGYMRSEPRQRVWFDRLLIDRRYQHRGYGRLAVAEMVERIRGEFPGKDIYLSAYDTNPVAIRLYESFGFRRNGELDTKGEKIMVLKAE